MIDEKAYALSSEKACAFSASDDIKKNGRAQLTYEAAAEALLKFVETYTDMGAEILTEKYPFSVHFTPNEQITMFDTEGELNDLTVTVGISTSVKSNLKFKMDAGLLKKLIRLSEKAGSLYYIAYREGAEE